MRYIIMNGKTVDTTGAEPDRDATPAEVSMWEALNPLPQAMEERHFTPYSRGGSGISEKTREVISALEFVRREVSASMPDGRLARMCRQVQTAAQVLTEDADAMERGLRRRRAALNRAKDEAKQAWTRGGELVSALRAAAVGAAQPEGRKDWVLHQALRYLEDFSGLKFRLEGDDAA